MIERNFKKDYQGWFVRAALQADGWSAFIFNRRGRVVSGFTGIDGSLSADEALDRAKSFQGILQRVNLVGALFIEPKEPRT